MLQLLDLPHEILRCIIAFTGPTAWASLSCSCRFLGALIYNDPLLWKDFFLQTWDVPPHNGATLTDQDWQLATQRYVKLHKILQSDDEYTKKDYFEFVDGCLMDLFQNGVNVETSKNRALLQQYFLDEKNKQIFLCHSTLFIHARREYPELWSTEKRQMSAKLHCLHGRIIQEASNGAAMHPYACSKVYNLSNYTTATLWGPFLTDGSMRIDWEMVEALMIVLAYNLRNSRVFSHRFIQPLWDRPWVGAWKWNADDLYGVTGTWMRLVVMLDYQELTAFNALPPEQQREPLMAGEVMRLIVERKWITGVEQPGPNDDPDWPVVHFWGSSSPRHATADPTATGYSNVRGFVRMSREGEIHWTTWVIFNGQERFRTEAVQVGGLRSERGIIGCWFDKDYRPGGPAGPTSFWRVSDAYDIEDADVDGHSA